MKIEGKQAQTRFSGSAAFGLVIVGLAAMVGRG